MAIKVLKQIEYDVREEKVIEEVILRALYYIIFYPILQIDGISKNKIVNNASIKLIEEAIKNGTLYYEEGKFKGKFNSKLSKELKDLGAKFNIASKTFSIEKNKLPPAMQIVILQQEYKDQQFVRNTLKAINTIDSNKISFTTFTPEYEMVLTDLDLKFENNIENFAVLPELNIESKKQLAKNYSENLKLYIKDFIDEEVLTLRKEVEQNVYAGFRREKLIKILKERYGISQRKAKFLAKQETSLLTTQFTKERYLDAGVKKFEWTRSHSKRPDEYHKTLYGKIFSFDNPPVINEKTQQRGLPGERYGCGCGIRAVIEIND